MSGRQILDIAKKGVENYRKALAFASKKWDLKSNTPLESGYTKENLIDFVRLKMYEVLILNVTYIDSSDEEGEHDLLDDNEHDNIKAEESNNNEKGDAEDKMKNVSNKDDNKEKKELDVQKSVLSSPQASVKKVDKQHEDNKKNNPPVKKGKKTKRKKKKMKIIYHQNLMKKVKRKVKRKVMSPMMILLYHNHGFFLDIWHLFYGVHFLIIK